MSQHALAYPAVLRILRRQHFAVLATADAAGQPASAGVTYALAPSGAVLYVMTRRHLQKARNIATNNKVSLVIPVPRRMIGLIPPATIQLYGEASILDWTDTDAREVFSSFLLGRQIITSYEAQHARGEWRICFLHIELAREIRTYMVGKSIWQIRSNMESGAATVTRP